jgi:hypothetical protein
MADITSSRIEPLAGGSENHPDNSRRRPAVKPKAPALPASAPPPVESEEERDEFHQLDELA